MRHIRQLILITFLAFICGIGIASSPVLANPQGGTVAAGAVTITTPSVNLVASTYVSTEDGWSAVSSYRNSMRPDSKRRTRLPLHRKVHIHGHNL